MIRSDVKTSGKMMKNYWDQPHVELQLPLIGESNFPVYGLPAFVCFFMLTCLPALTPLTSLVYAPPVAGIHLDGGAS